MLLSFRGEDPIDVSFILHQILGRSEFYMLHMCWGGGVLPPWAVRAGGASYLQGPLCPSLLHIEFKEMARDLSWTGGGGGHWLDSQVIDLRLELTCQSANSVVN